MTAQVITFGKMPVVEPTYYDAMHDEQQLIRTANALRLVSNAGLASQDMRAAAYMVCKLCPSRAQDREAVRREQLRRGVR